MPKKTKKTKKQPKQTVYYVVQDNEGCWLTETPAESDVILFSTTDPRLAEFELGRAVGSGDDIEPMD